MTRRAVAGSLARRTGPVIAPFLLAAACLADSGRDAFQFLKMGADARQSAMAGAAVAAPAGVTAAQDNPAAWAGLPGREASVHYASPADGLSFTALAYGQPARTGAWGVHLQQLRYGGLRGYDESAVPTGDVSAGDLLLSAGYGRSWRRDVDVGMNVKQAREQIAGRSAAVFLGDAGILFRPSGGPLSLGAALRNVGGKTSFLSERVSAVRTLEAGAAWRAWSDALLLAVRAGKASDEKWSSSVGAELWLQNALAFRAGLRTGKDLGTGLALGMGFRVRDVGVDYAFEGNGDGFKAAHRVTLSFRFGAPAEALYQEGLSLLQKGRYAEAVLKFKAALDLDPRHHRAERAFQDAVRDLERERSGT